MGISLYELTGNFRQVLDMEVDSAEDAEAMVELLDEAGEDIETKVLRIGYVIKTLESEAEAARQEEKRIAALRKVRENKIKRLKDYAKTGLEAAGLQRVQDAAIQMSLAKNRESLQILDEAEVPEEFVIVEKYIDRRSLTEYVKENPECEFAWLESSGMSLRIK